MGSSVILPAPGQPLTGVDKTFYTAPLYQYVRFGFDGIDPPSALYVQRDDTLVLSAATLLSSDTVTFTVRMLQPVAAKAGQPDSPSGAVVTGPAAGQTVWREVEQITPTVGNGNFTKTIQLQEGYLLSVAAICSTASSPGQTFVRAQLSRPGGTIPFNTMDLLFADYATTGAPASWPNGRATKSVENPGFVHSLQVTNPAAGADWAMVVPVQQRRRVGSFTAQFVASAAVANRNIEVIVDDGGNAMWRTSAAASVTAGTTQQLSATGTNQPTGVVTTDFTVTIPPGLVMPTSWRVRTLTTGIQAGDQWSNIWFNVEDWVDSL